MSLVRSLTRDLSLSALAAGAIAVAVSYAGPAAIIFEAAKSGGLSPSQVSSWIWAVSVGSGITGIYLSLRFKAPVITAWSTPGAALLVSSLGQYGYAEALGAYIVSALLIAGLGVTNLFSRVMAWLPKSLVAAMLAGVLFRFGIGLFLSLEQASGLVLPIVAGYLVGRRLLPRYAVVLALATGLCVAASLGLLDGASLSLSLAEPQWTSPSFTLSAVVGLGLPLCFVTMASQNAPGVGVLQSAGYSVPVSPLVTTTGLWSLLLAPFGAHGINLAAITAAICTGPECHPERERRYVAGVACGSLYLLVGAFGTTVVSLFILLPVPLVTAVAGLALLGALAGGLAGAMHDESRREAGLVAFLITASGVSFFGVGSAFWGMCGGLVADGLIRGRLPRRSRGDGAIPRAG
ncbi:benzoate/H(+) symporter BenE family transporter [Phaeospirillum tilakii]|uniref:Benzoate/H(+) symporter BenE family transporter n=1 Tax=Phaeospirillum tilakii TaxID=741673 RepID=A0ABW5CBQ9_9PROT